MKYLEISNGNKLDSIIFLEGLLKGKTGTSEPFNTTLLWTASFDFSTEFKIDAETILPCPTI